MKAIHLALAMGMAAFLSACSSDSVTSSSKSVPIVDAKGAKATGSGPTNYSISANAGPATLAALALRHHPRLKALRYRAERLEQKVPQAQSLPDPTANLALGNLPETAAGQVDAVLGVKQKIPYPGKRRSAAMAAAQEALAVRAEARAYELKLTEQVYSAWWDYYLSSINIRISSESQELLRVVEETVDDLT